MFTLDTFQVSDATAQKWENTSTLPVGALEDGEGLLLQTTSLQGVGGRESRAFLGQKYPIIYYDARSSQFQVNWVDVGCKLDWSCKFVSDSEVNAHIYTELSLLDRVVPAGQVGYPQTTTLKSACELAHLKLGQRAIVGRAHGVEVQRYLKLLGVESGSQKDNVFFVISVERP